MVMFHCRAQNCVNVRKETQHFPATATDIVVLERENIPEKVMAEQGRRLTRLWGEIDVLLAKFSHFTQTQTHVLTELTSY